MIDELSKRFTELYKPHKEVAVDKAMIKFTGCSSVKQYMPMKPIKRGIKVHSILIIHAHGGLAHGVHNLVSLQLYLIYQRTHTHTHQTLNIANKGVGTC